MTPLQNRFGLMIRQLQIHGNKVLVAVSGGLDSMVLADLCRSHQMEMVIGHINHGLRGTESDLDQAFVSAYALEHSVPFKTTQFSAADFESHDHQSVQARAHDLRLAWLHEVAETEDCAFILTGHHEDDQHETMLMALLRGDRLALNGLAQVIGKVARPLLTFSRNELEQYAKDHGLDWREDPSNATDKYLRNRIRHHLVPLLAELEPGYRKVMNRLAFHQNELLELAELSAENQLVYAELKRKNGPEQYRSERILYTPSTYLMLHQMLNGKGFHSDVIRAMVGCLERPEDAMFSNDAWEITINNKRIMVRPVDQAPPSKPKNTLTLEATEADPTHLHLADGRSSILVDAGLIDLSKLTLRPWQEGDKFRPFGMEGWKKVSDLLTDAKVRGKQRDEVIVLCHATDIVWVIGHRMDDRFRVTDQTAKAYLLSAKRSSEHH